MEDGPQHVQRPRVDHDHRALRAFIRMVAGGVSGGAKDANVPRGQRQRRQQQRRPRPRRQFSSAAAAAAPGSPDAEHAIGAGAQQRGGGGQAGPGGRAGGEVGNRRGVATEQGHGADLAPGGEAPPDDGAIGSAGVEGGGRVGEGDGGGDVVRGRGGRPQGGDGGALHPARCPSSSGSLCSVHHQVSPP